MKVRFRAQSQIWADFTQEFGAAFLCLSFVLRFSPRFPVASVNLNSVLWLLRPERLSFLSGFELPHRVLTAKSSKNRNQPVSSVDSPLEFACFR